MRIKPSDYPALERIIPNLEKEYGISGIVFERLDDKYNAKYRKDVLDIGWLLTHRSFRNVVMLSDEILARPDDELEVVIAHELSHLHSHDTLITIAYVLPFMISIVLMPLALLSIVTLRLDTFVYCAITIAICIVIARLIALHLREGECRSDHFAVTTNRKKEAFIKLLRYSESQRANLSLVKVKKCVFKIYGATHPSTNDRISRIEQTRLND